MQTQGESALGEDRGRGWSRGARGCGDGQADPRRQQRDME